MSNWVWALFGGTVTLAAAAVVVLWQAFKHLDLKIERLGERLDDRLGDKIDKKFDDQRKYFDEKLDKRFDQLADSIAEVSRLVAGHGELIKVQGAQIEAHEKQIDRLSGVLFAPPRLDAPGQPQQGEHAPEPAASAEAAAPGEGAASAEPAASGEGVASSAGGPEPTPPTAAIAPA